jgi:hypothetical protein
MKDIAQDGDLISRAELAKFVVDEFKLFESVSIALHQWVAGTGSPGPIILGRGFRAMFES